MALLDQMLSEQGGKPGINPQLEEMLARFGRGAQQGVSPPQTGNPSLQQTGLTPTAVGMPQGGGATAQAMTPEQANLTYQTLVMRGVPEDTAKAAIGNPQLLQKIILQLFQSQRQQGGAAPMAAQGQTSGGGMGNAAP